VRILDLFAGSGGAGRGYELAGFDVYSVDLDHQALVHNPHATTTRDALAVMRELLRGERVTFWRAGAKQVHRTIDDFDAIHASPPCQRWSTATANADRHPDLITPLRPLLERTGLPYVIENVPKAPLTAPTMLCGSMFGLKVRRHRHFETSFDLDPPKPCDHKTQGAPVGVYGDHWDSREFLRPDGTRRGAKARSLAEGQEAMGIDWMPWRHLKEAIPPSFTAHIGCALAMHINGQEVAA